MPTQHRYQSQDFEYFQYRTSWIAEFKSETCRVEEWRQRFPDQFETRRNGRGAGRLGYFHQYALQYILRRDYGINSVTWMHMGAVKPLGEGVDQLVPIGRTGQKCSPRWQVMRRYMGTDFDRLQRALFLSRVTGKGGGTGEPDLFCFRERDDLWFFAEVKSETDTVHSAQETWWAVAEAELGSIGRPFLCRTLPEGSGPPAGCMKHTDRWTAMVK
jgi:hypothetical protein